MTLTETERIILKNTDKRCRYIARDEDGDLFLYGVRPIKLLHCYKPSCLERNCQNFEIFNHLFQDIKWEDKSPLRFRDKNGEFIL